MTVGGVLDRDVIPRMIRHISDVSAAIHEMNTYIQEVNDLLEAFAELSATSSCEAQVSFAATQLSRSTMLSANPDPLPSASMWCELHGVHREDPDHVYEYPACERKLRWATQEEDDELLQRLQSPVMTCIAGDGA